MDSTPSPVVLQQAQPSRLKRVARRLNVIFMVTVLIPTLLAVLYYGVIASDVYISESRFVVKSPQRQMQTGLGALLQGTGLSRSQDDTYSVHDYIRSRDALRELDTTLKVRGAYARKDIDPFSRFPGLWIDDSFEAFHEYYQNHVEIGYDTASAISVLLVRAHTAEEARAINDMLLKMGEQLVNNLNSRSRQDLIDVAEREVRLAEEKAKTAALALSTFRAKGAVFDPSSQSALQLQGVARLQEELLGTESQLAQMQRLAPDNPQIGALSGRVQSLRQVIATETAKVTGAQGSLNAQAPVFDRLVLEKGFADRQLASTLASLESARSEAQRKQIYLERLVEPNLPDMAVEPRRIRGTLTVLILGLVAWGVVSLVLASVREHQD